MFKKFLLGTTKFGEQKIGGGMPPWLRVWLYTKSSFNQGTLP